MDTYLIPVSNQGDLYIDRVQAYSFNHAKEKYMQYLCDDFDIDTEDWDDLLKKLSDKNVFIGDIYLKDEF